MSFKLTAKDRWTIGAIYAIPIAVLVAALAMAFQHAEQWHGRHAPHAPAWEGWAFATMIELPAIMGLLLLSVFPKIAPGRKPTIPRLLFGSAAVISLTVQQAYAGSGASASERIVAGFPSVVAGIFVEIVFWVVGLVDEVKTAAVDDEYEKRVTPTSAVRGVGVIPDMPALAPMSPLIPDAVSPPTRPPTSPDMTGATGADVTPGTAASVTPTPDVADSDIPQVTPHVTPSVSHPAPPATPWGDMPADRGDVAVDVALDDTPAPGDSVAPDTGADAADVTPDAGGDMTDPRWAEAAVMRRRGDTVSAIAQHFGVAPRTVQRWKLPAPDDTKPLNGHVPELTGVKN